jgi:hypothetical protein
MGESMTGTGTAPAAPPPMGLSARLFGVIFSPYRAYEAIAARPRWFGALAVTLLITGVGQFGFLSTEVGQQALFDQQIATLEGVGLEISDAQYASMEQGLPAARYFAVAQIVAIAPIIYALLAGLILGIFNAIMGGNGTFRQAYAVVVHAGFVPTIMSLVTIPLNYARESMSSPMRLNALLPMLDEEHPIGMFLGMVDLLVIWWIVSMAIGTGVMYGRRTGPIMTAFIAAYIGIVTIITGVRLAL